MARLEEALAQRGVLVREQAPRDVGVGHLKEAEAGCSVRQMPSCVSSDLRPPPAEAFRVTSQTLKLLAWASTDTDLACVLQAAPGLAAACMPAA